MSQYYDNLVELACICTRQAKLAQTEDVARTLHRMAREYLQEAAKLDDGKIPDKRASTLPPVFGADRAMPHEELRHFSDQRLLNTLCASVNDTCDVVRRTLELIEQSHSMLRELDIHGADGRRIS
jgi:hypothetical protein